jgi:serralysin
MSSFASDGSRPKRSVSDYLGALDTGARWNKNPVKYHFHTLSDPNPLDIQESGEEMREWDEIQKQNYRVAIQEWNKVSDLNIVETGNVVNADIKLILLDDPSYHYLGHAYFPNDEKKGENYVSYNSATDKNFTVGSYDYITMVHEFGHTLGLAHPHDGGGTSTLFPGVQSWSDLGTNQQNQTIYTVMSYNDLNGTITPDEVQNWGFVKGPMAYDIAVMQHKYGHSNVQVNITDTVYRLDGTNGANTYFQSIVDTGGIDTIDASALSNNTIINLNAATLDGGSSPDSPGGGGLSQAAGIYGGITLSKISDIENAIGGSGMDRIYGNDLNNELKGGSGPNVIYGGKGDDRIEGGANNDALVGGEGNDRILGGSGSDRLIGGEGNDVISGQSGNDKFIVGPGRDTFYGGSGRDTAFFPGRRSNYHVIKYDGNKWSFTGRGRYRTLAGQTIMKGIEFVKFSRFRRRTMLASLRPNRRIRGTRYRRR